ncbi:acyl-CoA carboxylase subunit epsilon [Streptomyces virginiae]|uniref:acyl-CoA carboxylase subunit epsilon n=1 Tax=Streptomyces virginiae TaxID=1961 RepID=UPI00224D60A2|nr:acyl-CoA carboxylase subunit epsilon [Streptomyces virginiae]MCX5276076.1 acyl-CoA carboxylase subunit epsilon [Streptomyces virginiae]
MTTATDTLLRVEKGNAAPEELAAITAILLARAAAMPEETPVRLPGQAGWRRPERSRRFQPPHSWR